jgi:hypothetical protein
MKKLLVIPFALFVFWAGWLCATDPVTPNIGLTLMVAGETDWNVPLNNNFSLIDTAFGNLPNTYQPVYPSGAANLFLATPSSTTGVPSERAIVQADLPSLSTQTIAYGTAAIAATSIGSAACVAATITTTGGTAANIATTDSIAATFQGDPTSNTGFIPSTSGMLSVIPYVINGSPYIGVETCNNTGSSITPTATTITWRVTR